MITSLWLAGFAGVLLTVSYFRTDRVVGTVAAGAFLVVMTATGHAHWLPTLLLWLAFLAVATLLNVTNLRRQFISTPMLAWFRKVLPPISNTELEAIEAGTVWWDGELFSGSPNWNLLLSYPKPTLTPEEKAFLDGPTEELCRMADDWEITFERMDLPPQMWQFIKSQGFLGMIIPKEFGGKGFSAYAHSQVTMKLASRSADLSSTVMVPNSLGPAELLLQYGTEAQRKHYLPRLATGEDIPCFALTSPEAGSDAAGSMTDVGVVCKGQWNGEEVLGLRVTWEKRYITLAPVATVMGLAFKAQDPEQLLGEQLELGITLALVPTETPGVSIGRRHFPLNAAFMNGPTSGEDVFIPMSYIIGGQEMIGKGWIMLMNALSVGRSISLPAGGTGASKAVALLTGAYARIRRQFKLPIGEFEGVQEAMARIGGNTYVVDAARTMTAGAVDLGEKPSVLSAVVKYHVTERMRSNINDAMDIHGGKGICMGPHNYLGRSYQAVPISITVEGANILTRSMMIFGQGAIRCHPFVLEEMKVTQMTDLDAAHEQFDSLLFKHMGFALSNASRALLMGLTGGRLKTAPGGGSTRRYYQQLNRLSAAFALLADSSMLVLGGSLKRRERLSARLGDILSHLYLASACLKRYEDQGRPVEDMPLLQWGLEDCLYVIQNRMDAVLKNFPDRRIAALLRLVIFPRGRNLAGPSDHTGAEVARLMMQQGAARDRLGEGAFQSTDPKDASGSVFYAFDRIIDSDPIEQRIHKAIKDGTLQVADSQSEAEAALAAGLINAQELDMLLEADQARHTVIMVDDFDPKDVIPKRPARTKKTTA